MHVRSCQFSNLPIHIFTNLPIHHFFHKSPKIWVAPSWVATMWVSDQQQWSDISVLLQPTYTQTDYYQPAFAQTQLKAYRNWNTIPGKHQRNMLLVLIFIILSRMNWWMIFLSNIFSCWCNGTTCQLVNCKQFTNSQADFEPSFCICFCCLNLIESKTRFRLLRKRLIFSCRYRDSTLLNSLFYWLRGHIYITPLPLLVADTTSNKLSLVDMNSLLLTSNSVGMLNKVGR